MGLNNFLLQTFYGLSVSMVSVTVYWWLTFT